MLGSAAEAGASERGGVSKLPFSALFNFLKFLLRCLARPAPSCFGAADLINRASPMPPTQAVGYNHSALGANHSAPYIKNIRGNKIFR